jgi:carbamoylphosphate synthase large subunit
VEPDIDFFGFDLTVPEVLGGAGVPCARHLLVSSAEEAEAFAGDVGYPIVVKPPAGAGARGTFRLDEPDSLRAWLVVDPPSPAGPALMEEFLVGEEHSFDSVTVDHEVVWHSVSHYLPAPLEVLRNPWMQWVVLLPRDIDGPRYAGIRDAAPAALRALGPKLAADVGATGWAPLTVLSAILQHERLAFTRTSYVLTGRAGRFAGLAEPVT